MVSLFGGKTQMTFDEAKNVFRVHKTWRTATAYLDNAFPCKSGDTTGEEVLFDAIGEVADWLSASEQHLRGLEAAKAKACMWQKSAQMRSAMPR